MNLVPPSVIVVLNESSRHTDVGTDRRNDRVVAEGATCELRIRLRDEVVAHNLEDEIPVLRGHVPVVQQIGELRI
jgi:hypothetical protein